MMKDEVEVISSWKKAGLIVLIFSEIGLTPFLAEAVSETCDIIFLLSTHEPAPPLLKTIVGYSLAVPYVIAAMLSVGDLDKTIKKLMARNGEAQDINIFLKSIQQILIGLGFLVGSFAAALGVLDRFGKSPECYAFAAFTLLGQICVVLLQANKRIIMSAQMIETFFRHHNKKELLKNLCHQQMIAAILNTLINAMYWGSFYYYISADLNKVFPMSYEIKSLLAPLFGFLGAYMSISTQGFQEIKTVNNKLLLPTEIKSEEVSQIQEPTFMSLSLTTLSFLCRVLATASFVYSVITQHVESEESFNQTASIIALCMMIPGSFSALQYTKYIHNQVKEALSSIGNGFSRCRSTFFYHQKDLEQPLLTEQLDNVVINQQTIKTPKN